jgi:hypothetical protein
MLMKGPEALGFFADAPRRNLNHLKVYHPTASDGM